MKHFSVLSVLILFSATLAHGQTPPTRDFRGNYQLVSNGTVLGSGTMSGSSPSGDNWSFVPAGGGTKLSGSWKWSSAENSWTWRTEDGKLHGRIKDENGTLVVTITSGGSNMGGTGGA